MKVHPDRICAHCAQPMRGMASLTRDGEHHWLCHPDEGMDCYHLVTVWRHEPTTKCARCADPKEAPWVLPV